MIKYPENWKDIGHEISIDEIANAIQTCIYQLNIRNLSLSGGIDSTLLLYFMKKVLGDPINCYTITFDENHPDYIYAKMASEFFNVNFYPYFLNRIEKPDDIVKIFYKKLNEDGIDSIIAGDGIDEFSCGYYSHQQDQSEENYISWIRRLNNEQLTPLNENSGNILVHLPYLSTEVINLLVLIPLYTKVDTYQRKKIIMEMAKDKIPKEIIERWKYGFCDATIIKNANK